MLRSSDREVLFLRQFSFGKTNVWENQNSLFFASYFFRHINRQEQTLEQISPPYSWWLNRKNEYEEGKLFIVWPQDQSGSIPSLNPWQKRWACVPTPLISTNACWNNPILMSLLWGLSPVVLLLWHLYQTKQSRANYSFAEIRFEPLMSGLSEVGQGTCRDHHSTLFK